MKRARESEVIIDLTSDNWNSDSDLEVVDVQVITDNKHGPNSHRPDDTAGAGVTTKHHRIDEGYTIGDESQDSFPENAENESDSDYSEDLEGSEKEVEEKELTETSPIHANNIPNEPESEHSTDEEHSIINNHKPTTNEPSIAESEPSITASAPPATHAPSEDVLGKSPHPDLLPKFITLTVVSIVPYKEYCKDIRWLPRKPFYRLLGDFSSENVVIVYNNQAVKIYSTPSHIDPSVTTMKLLILTKRQFQDTMLLPDPSKAFAIALNPQQPESTVDLVSSEERQFPIKLKGAHGLVRVMVTLSTQCKQLTEHYAKEMKVSSPLSIKLDGDDVKPETTVEEMDLEEDDMLDVHS